MKTISEIRKIMLDCLDPDDLEGSKKKLNILCTPEEIQSMKDFNKHYDTLANDVNTRYKLGIITKAMKKEQISKIYKEKHSKLEWEK